MPICDYNRLATSPCIVGANPLIYEAVCRTPQPVKLQEQFLVNIALLDIEQICSMRPSRRGARKKLRQQVSNLRPGRGKDDEGIQSFQPIVSGNRSNCGWRPSPFDYGSLRRKSVSISRSQNDVDELK